MEAIAFDFTKQPLGPICKAVHSSGDFGKRSLMSEEAGKLLNQYLGISGTERATTSHSLKATLLAWAARIGMDDNSRTLLEHHTLRQDSLACYSRDMLSKPVRELCEMLASIRSKTFDPDATRSGWLSKQQAEHARQNEVVTGPNVETVDIPDICQSPGPQRAETEDAQSGCVEGFDLICDGFPACVQAGKAVGHVPLDESQPQDLQGSEPGDDISLLYEPSDPFAQERGNMGPSQEFCRR